MNLTTLLSTGRAADSFCSKEAIVQAQAVACVRVTKTVKELKESGVTSTVTFSISRDAVGLGEAKELTVLFSPGEKEEKSEGAFAIGSRCIVLMVQKTGRWEVAGWLVLNESGKFVDAKAGRELGLKLGLDAGAVVDLLSEKIRKDDDDDADRPKSAPTGRNQAWNLMRASPLRRVWPFFPR